MEKRNVRKKASNWPCISSSTKYTELGGTIVSPQKRQPKHNATTWQPIIKVI